MKSKFEQFYGILSKGGRIEHEGVVFAMSDDGQIGTVVRSGSAEEVLAGRGEERLALLDWSLNTFVSIANRIPDDDLFVAGAEVAISTTRIQR